MSAGSLAASDPSPTGDARLQKVRVELLATIDCPHAARAEQILRDTLEENGYESNVARVYVSDLDHAAGLGFHGSPTIRIEGIDVAPIPPDMPINLGCRLYPKADGHGTDGVVPPEIIRAALARR